MRNRDVALSRRLNHRLRTFAEKTALPGIEESGAREALVAQMIDSIRRVQFVQVLGERDISAKRMDPTSELFDPVKAAASCLRSRKLDDAFWFVFLSVHFGRHLKTGWRLARDVYGRLGEGRPWTWSAVSRSPASFRTWLASKAAVFASDGIKRGFGNHRKYLSLDAGSPTQTGAAFETYVRWVGPTAGHVALFSGAIRSANGDPKGAFDILYQSMTVASFGRTAKFDYLTMIGKLGLAQIAPGIPYLRDATGPLMGARLLFAGTTAADSGAALLEGRIVELGAYLELGMQEMEDSLCNWQKSPGIYRSFRG